MGNINIEMFKLRNENDKLHRELNSNSPNKFEKQSVGDEYDNDYNSKSFNQHNTILKSPIV